MRPTAALATVFVFLSCTTSAPSTESRDATATAPPLSTTAITAPPTSSPAPSAVLTEAAAWSRVKSSAQTAYAIPTWLPSSIDRSSVEVRDVSVAPNPPGHYTVVYRTPSGAAIVFMLGPADPISGSGIGTVVRGQDATLTFPSTVFADPAKPATRRVRWIEGSLIFSITSDVFSGDDLLRIAWNLDPTSAPPPKNSFTRTLGSCTRAAPEDTAMLLVSLIGSHRPEAVADCFSDEYLGRSGMGLAQTWANLPTARLDRFGRHGDIGGRAVLQVSWTFASNPGGAWNQNQTMFFTVGLDHDRWRIYELGTAGGGRAP